MTISPHFGVWGESPKGYSKENILKDVTSWASEIEEFFGPATNQYSVKGVQFSREDDEPCIFYPTDYPDTVIIRVVGAALTDKDVARFQIAHELVHCLSPSGTQCAKVFEEGMAAWYQQRFSEKYLNGRVGLGNARYKAARKAFMKAYKKDKNFVVKLREVEPEMWKIEKGLLRQLCSKVSDEWINILSMPFNEFTGEIED